MIPLTAEEPSHTRKPRERKVNSSAIRKAIKPTLIKRGFVFPLGTGRNRGHRTTPAAIPVKKKIYTAYIVPLESEGKKWASVKVMCMHSKMPKRAREDPSRARGKNRFRFISTYCTTWYKKYAFWHRLFRVFKKNMAFTKKK